MPPQTLFSGVVDAVNSVLQRDYRHKGTFKAWRNDPPNVAVGISVVHGVFDVLDEAFPSLVRNAKRRPPSEKNWVYRSCETCSGKTLDAKGEVSLERALVQASKKRGRGQWGNQIPIASGLVNSNIGRRSAIDLVRKGTGGGYEFVELKVESNSPLYAAVEILQYGFVWLLSRRNKEALDYGVGTLLDAEDVRLNVLAPTPYYQEVVLGPFQSGVSSAVSEIGGREGVSMTFRFVQFPEDFKWKSRTYSRHKLCEILDELFPS